MATPPARKHRPRRVPLIGIMTSRPRLLVGIAVGLLVALFLPGELSPAKRLVFGWDAGVVVFLIAAYWHVARADIGRIKRQAEIEDEGRVAVLVLTALAALASLGAIVAVLGGLGENPPWQALLVVVVTLLLSWAFTHTIFALHYAHEYYGEADGGGLEFPGGKDPDYWDFVYFSFVIGMTFQVSDVQVTDRILRRTVIAHGVVAFLFNSALLALAVNIAASAM